MPRLVPPKAHLLANAAFSQILKALPDRQGLIGSNPAAPIRQVSTGTSLTKHALSYPLFGEVVSCPGLVFFAELRAAILKMVLCFSNICMDAEPDRRSCRKARILKAMEGFFASRPKARKRSRRRCLASTRKSISGLITEAKNLK
jgi:hypothetical protein